MRLPRHPRAAARFGRSGLRSATGLGRARFAGDRARALLAGNAAHSMQPLERPATAAFGLILMLLGHGVGWPIAVGGSQAITDALASLLSSLGGEIETTREVRSLDQLADARSVLFDVTPRQLLAICGDALPAPLPPRARPLPLRPGRVQARLRARRAGAVDGAGLPAGRHGAPRRHHGRDRGERATRSARGRDPRRPYVLVAQQSLFDPTRAPAGAAHALGLLPRAERLDAPT